MEFVIISDYDKGDEIVTRNRDVYTIIDVRCFRCGSAVEFEYLCESHETSAHIWLEGRDILCRRG